MMTKAMIPVFLGLCFAFATAPGMAGPIPSDLLFETITDQGGMNVNVPIDFSGQLPAEGAEGNATPITVPQLTVDFLEQNGMKSDRFHFDNYTVTVTSDNETPLARRPGAVLLPFNQFGEVFSVLRFTATSDGNPTPAGRASDTLVATVGSGQGPGGFTNTLPEPPNENTAESPLTFRIPAVNYDIQQADGTISDYVDVSAVTGFHLSSDDQTVYGQNPFNFTPDGFVSELNVGGGTLNYNLTFDSSEVVPEPSSLVISGTAAVIGLCFARWRRCAFV